MDIGDIEDGTIVVPPKKFINGGVDYFTCRHVEADGSIIRRIWVERVSVERMKEVSVYMGDMFHETTLKNVDVTELEIWYKYPEQDWILETTDKVVMHKDGDAFWSTTG